MPGMKSLLLKNVVFFPLVQGSVTCCPFVQRKVACYPFNKQTAVVLTPSYIVHQGLCCHFTVFTKPVTLFWVGLLHTPRVSMGITLLDFSGGAAALGPNNLWSSPPSKKSAIETTLMELPSMPK